MADKFVIIRMECWHTKTVHVDASKKMILNEMTFCPKCGKKRRITWREEL